MSIPVPLYITPITDRNASDITNKTSKAYFNVADWVRIDFNTDTVRALVNYFLSEAIAKHAVTTPTITSIPSAGQFNAFLHNIADLQSLCGLANVLATTPIKYDWSNGRGVPSPTYVDANLWESVLDLIYNSMWEAADDMVYCGVATVGQARPWQNRFRHHMPVYVPPAGSPVRYAHTKTAMCGMNLTDNHSFRRYN